MSKESFLRIHSIGIVVEDKEKGSDYIRVTPIEHLPFVNGKIADITTNYNPKKKDISGVASTSQITGDVVYTAKWLGTAAGCRLTADDVCKNETVVLWQYADTEQYYWDKIGREPLLRKKETVVFAISNKDGMVEFDEDSSYWVRWSSEEKKLHIHTSNNDGEVTSHDIILDTANGELSYQDGLDNSFKFSSNEGDLTFRPNKTINVYTEKAYIKAEKTTIDGNAEVTGDLVVGGSISWGSGGASGSGGIQTDGEIQAAGDIKSSATITADVAVIAPNIN